jgi:hypothetical protein
MVIQLKRGDDNSRDKFRILMSAKHIGLKDHPRGRAWRQGYRTMPHFLQEAIDFFDGKEEDVFDVLTQLEKAALLTPEIGKADIVCRALRDPYNEDPDFSSNGYIMGLLIPEDRKKPSPYFRLLAFQWRKWLPRGWLPYKIILCD